LQALQRMGLAEDLGEGRWRLADGFDATLRQMGERGDVIRLTQREMTRARCAGNGWSSRIWPRSVLADLGCGEPR